MTETHIYPPYLWAFDILRSSPHAENAGEDSYNPTDEEEKQLKTNIWFRVLLWAYPPTCESHKSWDTSYGDIAQLTKALVAL